MNNTLSITSLFKESWGLTRKHLTFLAVSHFIFLVVYSVLSQNGHEPSSILLNLGALMVQVVFVIGMLKIALSIMDGGTPESDQFFKVSLRECVDVFVAGLLVSIFVCVGIILFIVPGFIVLTRLSMTFYLIVDQKMSAWNAIKESWKITKGYGWTLFTFILVSMLVAIVSAIPLGLGLIISLPVITIVHGLLYRKISGSESDTVVEYVPVEPSSDESQETDSK